MMAHRLPVLFRSQGEPVVSTIDNLFVVNRDIPAAMGSQQLGQQPPKRRVFALPFAARGGRHFKGRGG